MKYFSHAIDDETLNILLDDFRLNNKYIKLLNHTNMKDLTSDLIETFDRFIPEKLKIILEDTPAWSEFKNDMAFHLNLCSYASNILYSQTTPYAKMHSVTTKTKEELNHLYNQIYSEIPLGYYSSNTSNYTKKLKNLSSEIGLVYNELAERGRKALIPIPISQYVAYQILNYRTRKSLMDSQLNETVFKEQIIASNLFFKLMDKKCMDNNQYLLNLYLMENDYCFILLNHLLSLDLSTFYDIKSVHKVLSMGCLLPNKLNATNLITNLLKYKERFSDPYFNTKYKPFGTIHTSNRVKEAIWIETVQEIILELTYFTFPVLEALHLRLLNDLTCYSGQMNIVEFNFSDEDVEIHKINSCNSIDKLFKDSSHEHIKALSNMNYLIQNYNMTLFNSTINEDQFMDHIYKYAAFIDQKYQNSANDSAREYKNNNRQDVGKLPYPSINYWLAYRNRHHINNNTHTPVLDGSDNSRLEYPQIDYDQIREYFVLFLTRFATDQFMYN